MNAKKRRRSRSAVAWSICFSGAASWGRTLDTLRHPLASGAPRRQRILVSSSFLRHCDETKILLSSIPSICLIGADVGHHGQRQGTYSIVG